MKKNFIVVAIIILLIIASMFVLRFVLDKEGEDSWLCVNGQWTQHGHPAAPQPTTGCGQATAQIANPASVYCEQQGGKLEIVTATDGSQSGLCRFSDGRQCDEWNFFRTQSCQ